MPPFADTNSESSPTATSTKSTFIDVILDHVVVCCAPSTDDATNDDDGSPTKNTASTGMTEDDDTREEAVGGRSSSAGRYPQEHASRTAVHAFSKSTSNQSPLQYNDSFDQQSQQHSSDTIILPHLRFNTLPSCSKSSLQDFFALFLADDAPHSFKQFHESNGDTHVQITPWKDIRREMNKIERTITFMTMISPGSSSNPLNNSSSSDHTTTNINNNNSSNNGNNGNDNTKTLIPLNVTILQSLLQHPTQPNNWILECQFSFDVSSSSIDVGGSGVGKKLGTGIGQYLMNNVVKGNVVTVSVTLRECDEGIEWINMNSYNNDPSMMRKGVARRTVSDSDAPSNMGGTSGFGSNSAQPSCHDGLLSCFSHPLLLPSEGLCSSSNTSPKRWNKKGFGRSKSDSSGSKQRQKQQNVVTVEEPSQVGASLLSAIKAKNSSDANESYGCTYSSLVTSPLLCMDGLPSCSNTKNRSKSEEYVPLHEQERAHQQQDVLSCNSRGSLKMKQIASFEVSRSPSMRHMILNKNGASNVIARSFDGSSRHKVSSDAAVPPLTLSASSSSVSQPQGLSMRIEMGLVGSGSSSSNNPQSISSTTSSVSSFSRSTSISIVDNKIRRGIKKRIARSFISWAESWCMRLWEEEEAERARRISSGKPAVDNDSNRRSKLNVRPHVRRIGDRPDAKQKKVPTTSSRKPRAKSASPPKNVWKPINVEKSSSRRSERWMAFEHEDECGVEVECSLATLRKSSKPKHMHIELPKDQSPPPQDGSTPKPSMKKRLLRSLSTTTPSDTTT